jgi:hypothetical protein
VVNSPASPGRLTRRPHRSCRSCSRPMSRPEGSAPSPARLASAHYACSCNSRDTPPCTTRRCGAGFHPLTTCPLLFPHTRRHDGSGRPLPRRSRVGGVACLAHQQLIRRSARTAARRQSPGPWPSAQRPRHFAARLARLPTTTRAHGRNPPRAPERESASSVVEAATTISPTENGVSAATQPG